MGVTFEVIVGEPIDEDAFVVTSDLDGSLQRLARMKAISIAERYPTALVLSADTVVVNNAQKTLGKPVDRDDAKSMLLELSGCKHTVFTGVALTCREQKFCQSVTIGTDVYFRDLSTDEIDWYLNSNEPYDKAGAYGIQGKAMIFVDKIVGCFYNVVGLPVRGTIDLFYKFALRKEPQNVGKN